MCSGCIHCLTRLVDNQSGTLVVRDKKATRFTLQGVRQDVDCSSDEDVV